LRWVRRAVGSPLPGGCGLLTISWFGVSDQQS
jgi:hypothetical protein